MTLPRLPLRCRRRAVVAGLVGAWAVVASAQDLPPEHPSGWTDKRAVESRHFMVAAANHFAVEAAYRMLRAGGSAVDAAIAAQLVLGLTEPQSSGLGGGAFLLVHDARTRKLVAYDGRETAPAAAGPDRDARDQPLTSLYKLHQISIYGYLRVALDTIGRFLRRRLEPRVKLH